MDRGLRRQPARPLGIERDVDHHDRVLLHDADQQDHADERDDRELGPAQHQRQRRAEPGRRQRGEDRQRMNQALVQNPEDDVDRQRGRRESARVRSRARTGRRSRCPESCRARSPARRGRASRHRSPPRRRRGTLPAQVEGQRRRRELRLVIHRQRRGVRLIRRERAERHEGARRRSHVDLLERLRDAPGRRVPPPSRRDTDSATCRWSRPAAGRKHRTALRRSRAPGRPAGRLHPDRWRSSSEGRDFPDRCSRRPGPPSAAAVS